MNTTKLTTTILLAAAVGCGGDSTTSSSVGDDPITVDPGERQMNLDPDGDGVAEGESEGMSVSMVFTLSDPLPEIDSLDRPDDSDFREVDGSMDEAVIQILDALNIVVSSPRSGVSANLTTTGMLVSSPPNGPGEYSVTLNDERTEITFEWYNQTPSGLVLEPGFIYDVTYQLAGNCCVAVIPTNAMQFTVDAPAGQ